MNNVPEGYLRNAAGHLVPESLVSDIDKQRDELVKEISDQAMVLNKLLSSFKQQTFDDIGAFVDLSAEKYDKKLGGEKGNYTLFSYDGSIKVIVANSDRIAFDERLQVAKELIDECIHKWTEDSNDKVRALVEHAFQTDRQGKINSSRVLGLLKLEIDDDGWKHAMDAIKDSIQVIGSKRYIRVYKRIVDTEDYEPITLDLAAV